MQSIVIDKEFQALIPPLAPEELQQLEANIVADGCRDPLVVWNDTIIDGHNRYAICTQHGIDYQTISRDFDSRDDAKVWIIQNQFGRRNLPAFARAELALALKPLLVKQANQRRVDSGKETGRGNKKVSQNSAEPLDTRGSLASAAGVSHDTLAKVEHIRESAAPEIAEAARHGVLSINMASQLADLPPEDQAEVAEADDEDKRDVAREVIKRAHVSNNSGNSEWYTPPDFIEAARKVMGGIDLDPASSAIANQTVKADTYYTADDDGLKQAWPVGRIWMNPPYAQPLMGQFAERFAEEIGRGSTGIALVNNATETAWFQDMAAACTAICFPRTRVRFLDPEGNPGAPLQGQAVLYAGSDTAKFAEAFANFGLVVTHEV